MYFTALPNAIILTSCRSQDAETRLRVFNLVLYFVVLMQKRHFMLSACRFTSVVRHF